MNEEVNFCSQCGEKIISGAKFCSSCGHDLQNSSAQTPLDKTIKIEVTNAMVEKGFKAVGKGFGAVGKVFKRKEKREEVERKEESGRKIKIIRLFIILGVIGIIFLRMGIREESMSEEDYLQLGIERGASGKHDDAIEAFKKAMNINPNYVPAYLSLGNAYGNTGLYKESIASYKEGIQLNPKHPEVPQMEMNIAWVAHKMKDKKTAVLYAKRAIQSFTDRNDYAGVAMAGSRLRMIQENPGKTQK